MLRRQEKLIDQYYSRLIYHPDLLQPRLIDLDPEKLVNRLRSEYYNYKLLEDVSSIVYALTTTSYSDLSTDERIRNWLIYLKPINVSSVEGYALQASLKSDSNAFIIKTPRDTNNSLIHELFIGLYGTNVLRKLVPNFAYTFTGFKCTPPIIPPKDQPQAQVESYCVDSPLKVPYIVYENITPSVSFNTFCKTCTADEFLLIFYQLVLALRQGWITNQFVHNDLHGDNVLIRKIPQPISIPYQTPEGIRYITTDKIATIIDFGRSHIIYKNNHYGVSFEPYGLFPQYPLPILDMYKIIHFSFYQMMKANNWETIDQLTYLLTYFNPSLRGHNEIKAMLIRSNIDYHDYLLLPDPNLFKQFMSNPTIIKRYPERWIKAREFDYNKFYTYLNSFAKPYFLSKNPLAKVNVSTGSHISILSSLFRHSIEKIPPPQDLLDFYDLYTFEEGNSNFRQQVKDIFLPTFEQIKDQYVTNVQTAINNLFESLKQINSLTRLNLQSINYINSSAHLYREKFIIIANYQAIHDDISNDLKIGLFVADVYQDYLLAGNVEQMAEELSGIEEILNNHINSIIIDVNYLKRLRKPQLNGMPDDVIWIWNDLPKLVNIFH